MVLHLEKDREVIVGKVLLQYQIWLDFRFMGIPGRWYSCDINLRELRLPLYFPMVSALFERLHMYNSAD